MKKLDILILCRRYLVDNRGAETHTAFLISILSKQYNVKSLSYGKSNSLNIGIRQALIADNIIFNKISKLKYFNFILEVMKLSPSNVEGLIFTLLSFKVITRIKPQVIISTGGYWESFILTKMRSILKFKICTIGHGGYHTELDQLKFSPDLHITFTNIAREKLIINFPKSDIRSTHQAVDPKFFSSVDSIQLFNNSNKVVLIAAAAIPYKNIDKTIKSVSKTDFNLLICGDGPLKEELLTLAIKELGENRLKWLTVPNHEMPSIYRSADIFTLCSRKFAEAYGVVYFEAMTAGLPIVATDDPIRREILGDRAFYVDPDDINSYASALNKALKLNYAPLNNFNSISEFYLSFMADLLQR